MPKRTRRVLQQSYTGLTLEQWHAQTQNITWATLDPKFREICSVVLNESQIVIETAHGCSGERAFGRVEGYQMALRVLQSLARKPESPAPPITPTYEKPPEVPNDFTTD